jgi:5-methylcytosine-specific restriction protein A
MARAWSICSRCPRPVAKAGMCPDCKAKSDKRRRPDGNPYSTTAHRQVFREGVLAKNPRCVCEGDCGHHDNRCAQPSTVADHHPHERRDLITMGLDPNDPQYGRGLCKPCHDGHTARTSPGGWAATP